MKHLKYFGTGLLLVGGLILCSLIIFLVIGLLITLIAMSWYFLLGFAAIVATYFIGKYIYTDMERQKGDENAGLDPDEPDE